MTASPRPEGLNRRGGRLALAFLGPITLAALGPVALALALDTMWPIASQILVLTLVFTITTGVGIVRGTSPEAAHPSLRAAWGIVCALGTLAVVVGFVIAVGYDTPRVSSGRGWARSRG